MASMCHRPQQQPMCTAKALSSNGIAGLVAVERGGFASFEPAWATTHHAPKSTASMAIDGARRTNVVVASPPGT